MNENKVKMSEKEMKLHKKFHFWNETTSFTSYLMVLFMGATFYNFKYDEVFYLFILSILLHFFSFFSMKTILDDIRIERGNVDNKK